MEGESFPSLVGIVFEPGRTVAIDPQATTPSTSSYEIRYNLIGYLVAG